jgi:hypothetical protein
MTRQPHRLTRTAAGALAALALTAPAAAGREADVYPGSASPPVAPDTAPTVTPLDAGFDWESAAIGAGGATALVVLTLAGASAVTHRHPPRRVG